MIDNFFGPKTVFGEMYIRPADAYTVLITVADTFGPLSGFTKGKETFIDVDGVVGTFTAKINGSYKFDGVASLFPSAGMFLTFAVFVNGILYDRIESSIDFKNSQDTQTFSGTGPIDLKKGDIVSVYGKSDTVPVTVNINHMNINIFRVGP